MISLEDHRAEDFCSKNSFYLQLKLPEYTESWDSPKASGSLQKLIIRQENSGFAQLRAALARSQEAKSCT